MTCLVCLNVPESKLARPVNCRLKDNGRVRTNTFERCRKRSQDKRSERLTVKVRTRYFKSAFRVYINYSKWKMCLYVLRARMGDLTFLGSVIGDCVMACDKI